MTKFSGLYFDYHKTVINRFHAEYLFYVSNFSPNYPVNLQHSNCKHVFPMLVENSADSDQMASSEAS